MNICGCLIHVAPNQVEATGAALAATPGTEIHGQSDDGRFVVVVEDVPHKLASETIMDLHQIPGVVSVTLTYHHFEDPSGPSIQPESKTGEISHDHV